MLGSISAVTIAGPYVLPVLRSRNVWATISLIVVLAFTGGHMFNHIRKVPYVAGNGRGGISYFAGGFSNQFAIETQVIAAICMLCSPLAPAWNFLTVNRWRVGFLNNRIGTKGAED